MSQQNTDTERCQLPWYVMWHLSPQQIETLLQKDSAGLFRKPDEPSLPPYRFYVPFQYMPVFHAEQKDAVTDRHYKAEDDRNALRTDLHSFVFIQASEERLQAILSSDWNTKARLRLNYYRDTNHKEVKVSDTEMRQLIATIQDRHLQFYIDQPLDDFAAGDRVVMQMAPWSGKRGVVKKVAIKHGQLCMTVSMNILGRTKSINFTDIHVGDVLFENPEQGRMLSDNPITNYEEEIVDLLSHRFGRHYTDEVAEFDQQRLKRLATYDRIFVDDADEHARFVALKLICSYLRGDKVRRERYTNEVRSLLQSSSLLGEQGARDSYLMVALFIVTREAHWRTAVKEYRKNHPDDCPAILHRYFAIIKNLKAKPTSSMPTE